VDEATTRRLELETKTASAPTTFVNSSPTGPSYLSPSMQTPSPPAPEAAPVTKALETRSRPRRLWLYGLMGVLVIALLVAVVIMGTLRTWHRPTTPAPPPPPPAAPPSIVSNLKEAYTYPGSEVVMQMISGSEGVLQLSTIDPPDKVAEWYTRKLGLSERVKAAGQTVLKGKDATIVISGTDDGTHIIVTQEHSSAK
jgi:hypothetical protein